MWRAAEELHLTRSAVSHQLRFLERDLGFDLLKRDGKGVSAHGAGQALRRRGPQGPDCCSETLPSSMGTRASAVCSWSAARRGSRHSGSAPTWPNSKLLCPGCHALQHRDADPSRRRQPSRRRCLHRLRRRTLAAVCGRPPERGGVHAALQPGAAERDRRPRRSCRSCSAPCCLHLNDQEDWRPMVRGGSGIAVRRPWAMASCSADMNLVVAAASRRPGRRAR